MAENETRYRKGSIIGITGKGFSKHDLRYFAVGRRWEVLGVEDGKYRVKSLFSANEPDENLWAIALCEAATELEWQQEDEPVREINEFGFAHSPETKELHARLRENWAREK